MISGVIKWNIDSGLVNGQYSSSGIDRRKTLLETCNGKKTHHLSQNERSVEN
jgi:hypothetical protein